MTTSVLQWRPICTSKQARWTRTVEAIAHSTASPVRANPAGIAIQTRSASLWTAPSTEHEYGWLAQEPPSGALFFYPSFLADVRWRPSRPFRRRRLLPPNWSRLLKDGSVLALPSIPPIPQTLAHSVPTNPIAIKSAHSHSLYTTEAAASSVGTSRQQDEFLPPRRKTGSKRSAPRDSIAELSIQPNIALSAFPPLEDPSVGQEESYTAEDLGEYFREIVAAEDLVSDPHQPLAIFQRLYTRVHDSVSNGQTSSLRHARARLSALLRQWTRLPEHDHAHSASMVRWAIRSVLHMHQATADAVGIEVILRKIHAAESRNASLVTPITRPHLQRWYNLLIQAYARRLKSAEALDALGRLRLTGQDPSAYTFTDLVTMYAQKKDPESAEKMIDAMHNEAIPVPQPAYTSLMVAYIMAGFWDKAVTLFEFLDNHGDTHPLKPDLFTCTTLLKCYVLMGAPLDEVINIFKSIIARGMEPSGHTFSLLLHAACDAGATGYAEEVFAHMDRLDAKNRSRHGAIATAPLVDAYTFTIMIRGMLRAGQHSAAQEYYREMGRRNIKSTSATWSVMLKAYAGSVHEESDQIVKNLLDEFLASRIDRSTGLHKPVLYRDDKVLVQGRSLESVYGPIIGAYSKIAKQQVSYPQPVLQIDQKSAHLEPVGPRGLARKPEPVNKALSMLEHMLQQSKRKPSIHIYTAVLDSYRRVNDLSGLETMWSFILEAASLVAEGQATFSEEGGLAQSQRNLLCLPLSIYIDAMSGVGNHVAVADAWIKVQALGFGYDIGNWNHLIVALLRADDVDRAFWTAEAILQDIQKYYKGPEEDIGATLVSSTASSNDAGQSPASRLVQAESNVVSSGQGFVSENKANTPMLPPNRSSQFLAAEKRNLYRLGFVPRISDAVGVSLPPAQQDKADDQANDSKVASAQSIGSSVRDGGALTANYAILRENRLKQDWHVFAETMIALEDALLQADDRSTSSAQGNAVIEGTEQSHGEILRRKYPLIVKAMKEFRQTQRRHRTRRK